MSVTMSSSDNAISVDVVVVARNIHHSSHHLQGIGSKQPSIYCGFEDLTV